MRWWTGRRDGSPNARLSFFTPRKNSLQQRLSRHLDLDLEREKHLKKEEMGTASGIEGLAGGGGEGERERGDWEVATSQTAPRPGLTHSGPGGVRARDQAGGQLPFILAAAAPSPSPAPTTATPAPAAQTALVRMSHV